MADRRTQYATVDTCFRRRSRAGPRLRAEVNVLKAEIQAMLNRQLQIMMALMIAMTGIFATIVML
jgi:hypothetical protein